MPSLTRPLRSKHDSPDKTMNDSQSIDFSLYNLKNNGKQ